MSKIQKIHAREILDSRGNPTIELEMLLENGMKAWSSVPSGASTGKHEAVELRDKEERFHGKGVRQAIENIHKIIAPKIIGLDPREQKLIDEKMIALDGTENKSKLGANAILAVSLVIARLGAMLSEKKLYAYIAEISGTDASMVRPFFNVLNGGRHAGNQLVFQESMISPRADSFQERYRIATEVYAQLKMNLKKKFGGAATLLGDEGGFAPDIRNIDEVFALLVEAVRDAGYEGQVDFAIDAAASEFYEDGKYNLNKKGNEADLKTVDEMISLYEDLVEKYPIISIEDPFDEEDFVAFALLRKKIAKKGVQIVGDDLTVTNKKRITKAIDKKSCNALLLKINQIGTVTEAIEAFKLAKSDSWKVMVSHRSGETIDDFIADFAVGIGAEQVKFGAPARGERVVKYNRLLNIEEILSSL